MNEDKLSSTAVIKIDNGAAREAQYDLPQSYGKTESYLLPKDPSWLFLFWDIAQDTYETIMNQKGQEIFSKSRNVIRMYDITDINFNGNNAHKYYDIPVILDARSWYLQVPVSGRTYICDLGIISPEGEFIVLTRSNSTTVPPGKVSDVVDDKWMMVEGEYQKLLKMSGVDMFGNANGKNGIGASERLQNIFAQRWQMFELDLRRAPSSHITSWMSSKNVIPPTPNLDEDIWLKAGCEIIIYGQASQNANVFIGGKKINVNEDGSFSFRFPLSEGQVVDMPIKAQHKTKEEKKRFITIKAERKEGGK